MSSEIIRKQDEDPASRILGLIDSAEPNIRNTFLRIVQTVRSQRSLQQIADLLQSGRLEEALEFVDQIPAAVATAVSFTVVSAAESTAELIARVAQRPVSFDQTNFRAVNIMRESRLRLIREFSSEQRIATRTALVEGIQRGINPRDQARLFRDSIGLTSRQMQAVANYRRLLQEGSSEALNRQLRDRRFDRTVARAIRTDVPLSTEQVNRMVERYSERYLIYRSEVIGRTEALRSVHQGTEEMYQQSFDQGILQPNDLFRTWVTARDSRVRDTHNGMNGQQRRVGERFETDAGVLLNYPGDPSAPGSETIQCRCVVTTRFT